ncbi:MAG: stage III sporulation protein AE [Lachnospiraceae bacterium]|nr:stage III sporulation protein AE [Lachnospiraceae bacterium]
MKKWIVILAVSFVMVCCTNVHGASDVSLDDLEKEAKEQLESGFSIKEMVQALEEGNLWEIIQEGAKEEIKAAFQEEKELRELFVQMLLIGFMMAIFSNFSKAFVEQYVGTTGFYIAYMMICGLMIRQFLIMFEIVQETTESILVFVKVLIPTYSLVLVSVSGLTTSVATYELFFFLIAAVQWGIMEIILPCIKVDMILKLLNFLSDEELFTGVIELLESFIKLLLKGAIMVVLLFNIFQSMLLPAIDSVKSNVIQKGLGFLPGMGQVLGMVANTAIGSGIILKNAIGVAGMVVICLIALIPILKILIYIGSFLLAGALLQPVTDKRLYRALKGVAESGKLLLQSVLTSVVLFLLTLAIVSATTNMNYYVG